MGLLKRFKQRKHQRISAAPTLSIHSASRSPDAPRILFVSHEATRTGAPKIILNIVKHFQEKTDLNLQSILHSGGFLAEDFGRYSEVDCLNLPRESTEDLSRLVRKICLRHKDNPPTLAICNSMESRFIAYELQKHGIPIIFLIHELPSSYETEDYQKVYDCAEKIIFPVDVVHDSTHQKLPLPEGKCMVMPQGLLNAEFGKHVDRDRARAQIRQELKLPQDAYIVLGCGTLDLRKGIDHYCGVARTLLRNHKPKSPMHFVWLGEGDRWAHTPYHYAMLDVEKSNIFHNVHFIGEREDVQPWFIGSDVFTLTSRVDPFPCVLHEAMASRLPVITFDSSGGATECLSGGAGLSVPYANYEAMADRIMLLANHPSIADNIRDIALDKVRNEFCFGSYTDELIRLAEQATRIPMAKKVATQPTVSEPPLRKAA